jgi:hypothetical protein
MSFMIRMPASVPILLQPLVYRVRGYAKWILSAIEHNFMSVYVPDSKTGLPHWGHTTASITALLFPQFTQTKPDIHYEIALSRARRVVRQRKEFEMARQLPYANDSIASEIQVCSVLA